eukprot:TRINITY_DN9305_c0_g1_i4.p3 TRINITY_DN9305_c0_g1~~TRINITY_DN9305_c0_g1_i4.p3  ORF type:complete len:201 (+),score=13.17 TRINITY_DN9305_c0_g1_i4:1279-1881(+)
MAAIDDVSALRRSLRRESDLWQRRLEKGSRVPTPQAIKTQILQKPICLLRAALALQWSTGCRFIDLHLIESPHVRVINNQLLVTFLGGKTDAQREGQTLSLPWTGRYVAVFRRWLEMNSQNRIFDGLTRDGYNNFLLTRFDCTSQLVRHAALTFIARSQGEAAARHVARHRTTDTIRNYIPSECWDATRSTETGTDVLQQ